MYGGLSVCWIRPPCSVAVDIAVGYDAYLGRAGRCDEMTEQMQGGKDCCVALSGQFRGSLETWVDGAALVDQPRLPAGLCQRPVYGTRIIPRLIILRCRFDSSDETQFNRYSTIRR